MASDGRIGLDLDLWVKLLVKKKKKSKLQKGMGIFIKQRSTKNEAM